MIDNFEFHKGSFCSYTSIFCQEGFCQDCEIYRQKFPMRRAESKNAKKVWLDSLSNFDSDVVHSAYVTP